MFKSFIRSVVEHGRKILIQTTRIELPHQPVLKLTESPAEQIGRRLGGQICKNDTSSVISSSSSRGLFQYLGPMTSRFFQGIIRKVPSPIWVLARRKAARRLFGDTAPYFALVGVTLVSGPEKGLLTEKDELEALCGDIREAISKAGWIHNPDFWKKSDDASTAEEVGTQQYCYSLKDFEIGPVIDKGCNAVVYSAKWKHQEVQEETTTFSAEAEIINEKLAPLADLHLTFTLENLMRQPHRLSLRENSLLSSNSTERPAKRAKIKVKRNEEFPLAVKMLFNYEAESNAPAILNAMRKELLPARNIQAHILPSNLRQLPPHRNVVEMPCVFVDRIPLLEGGVDLYPQALPKRIYEGGFGRNMSLFCVMKRYDCTLSDFLMKYDPDVRTSLLLFTQLLESVHHLNKYNVAHRDLKCDNLLLDLSGGIDSPRLIVSDFGCSIATPTMKAPFPSVDADPRLGNLALMAPEIRGSVPGLLGSVNFASCDLWSSGTLAFELFGCENPFSSGPLNSLGYKESQIPKLPHKVPSVIRHLVQSILKRSPNQRPTAGVAATVAQLCLWAPSKWLNTHALLLPSHSEVTRWLLCLSTKVLCEAGSGGNQSGLLEYEMVSSFLARVQYSHIIEALTYIRS